MNSRKMTVGHVFGTIVLGGLILALLIFTASRTVHFLQMTFPPDFSYIAYLALAAFDGGMIGWAIFATSSAEGAIQRGLAYTMIGICLIGVVLTTVADTIISSGANGLTKIPPYMTTVGVWGSLAVIVLNVVAGVVTHLVSPSHMRKFELESIHDQIHQVTMQHIKESATRIAPQIAREQADYWVRQTIQDSIGGLPGSSMFSRIVDAAPPPVQQLAPASLAQSEGVIDPHKVKPEVDLDRAQPKKKFNLRELVSFAIPAQQKEVEQVQEVQDDDPDGYDEEVEDEDEEEGQRSPAEWTDEEWMVLRDKIDAFAFSDLWKLYKGDTPGPWEKPIVKKKKGKK